MSNPSPQPKARLKFSEQSKSVQIITVVVMVAIIGLCLFCSIGIATSFFGGSQSTANTSQATPTHQAATPTPAATAKDYTDWLSREVNVWRGGGFHILEAIYPNNDYGIIWVRTALLNQNSAKILCDNIASDYVAQFNQDVIVHIYAQDGFPDEIANCNKSP